MRGAEGLPLPPAASCAFCASRCSEICLEALTNCASSRPSSFSRLLRSTPPTLSTGEDIVVITLKEEQQEEEERKKERRKKERRREKKPTSSFLFLQFLQFLLLLLLLLLLNLWEMSVSCDGTSVCVIVGDEQGVRGYYAPGVVCVNEGAMSSSSPFVNVLKGVTWCRPFYGLAHPSPASYTQRRGHTHTQSLILTHTDEPHSQQPSAAADYIFPFPPLLLPHTAPVRSVQISPSSFSALSM